MVSQNPFWADPAGFAGPTEPLTHEMIQRQMEKVRLHLKTHKQGKVLYWVNGQFWIRCYTHKRLEPATWLL